MVLIRRNARHWIAHVACGGLVLAITAAAPDRSKQPLSSVTKKQEPPEEVANKHAEQASSDLRGTENRPFVVRAISAQKSEEEAAEDKADRDEKTSSDRWMIELTGALVLVGAIQGVVFFVQAKRLKDSISKMDEIATSQGSDMASSIIATKENGAAVREMVNAIGVSTFVVNRAYMLVQAVYFSGIFEPDGTRSKITWAPKITNVGKTPTRNIAACSRMFTFDCAEPTPAYEKLNEFDSCAWVDVGSGSDLMLAGADFPIGLWDEIKSGKTFLFILGAVEYNSIFPADKERHRTEFFVRIALDTVAPLETGIRTTPWGPHNGTDDSCHLKPFTI